LSETQLSPVDLVRMGHLSRELALRLDRESGSGGFILAEASRTIGFLLREIFPPVSPRQSAKPEAAQYVRAIVDDNNGLNHSARRNILFSRLPADERVIDPDTPVRACRSGEVLELCRYFFARFGRKGDINRGPTRDGRLSPERSGPPDQRPLDVLLAASTAVPALRSDRKISGVVLSRFPLI
jgi:hypothetical protein